MNHTTKGLTLQEFYDDTIDGIKSKLHKNPILEKDIFDIFKCNGKSINEILTEMNN